MSTYDVSTICNALIDLLVECEDSFLQQHDIYKGVMHLVDGKRQESLLKGLENNKITTNLGGSALNAIRSLAHLGAKTAFNGAIGKDKYGELVTHKMQDLNIDHYLTYDELEPTGTCVVLVTPDGERTMNTCLGASRNYSAQGINFDSIKDARIFHFCGYQWDTDEQKDAIRKAIAVAKSAGRLISFDVADPFVIDRNRDEFLTLISESADIVFANQKEAEMLFGTSPADTAKKIASYRENIAVIKMGSEGAIVHRGREQIRIAAEPTTVVDTTAAGDMFAGGFLYGLTRDRPLAICGKMAATLASCVISRIGTQVSPETYEAVKKM